MTAYLEYNPDVFRDKTILLPCDDPEWSNFTRYFAQNFQQFGLKKLISTSYAVESKKYKSGYQPSLFETSQPQFDPQKSLAHGKLFVLDRDVTGDNKVDIEDLRWEYLEGDGDFSSGEVTELRDEADFVITNPPFSLFRDFLSWIFGGGKKQFSIIGSMNAITYKEVFPLIKDNQIWLGNGFKSGNAFFATPFSDTYQEGVLQKNGLVKFRNCCWFTNIEHGRRHERLRLMTMEDNLRYDKNNRLRGRAYQQYDNYDAIEVPYTSAIPSDYAGVMGVPVSFLDKYNPGQFEILGATESEGKGFSNGIFNEKSNVTQPLVGGERRYKRLFVRITSSDKKSVS